MVSRPRAFADVGGTAPFPAEQLLEILGVSVEDIGIAAEWDVLCSSIERVLVIGFKRDHAETQR